VERFRQALDHREALGHRGKIVSIFARTLAALLKPDSTGENSFFGF